jgi:hypothetical protein
MTSRDFAYWLQGFFEIESPVALTIKQMEIIKKHLNLVFKHEIDPSMGDEEHQAELDKIHNKPTLTDDPPTALPLGWTPDWEYSTMYKIWYDPKSGVPRC